MQDPLNLNNDHKYITSETELATYLIQEGFVLLSIVYQEKLIGKTQGLFVFDDSPELRERANIYSKGDAVVNLSQYEHTKSGLIDRIKRKLP